MTSSDGSKCSNQWRILTPGSTGCLVAMRSWLFAASGSLGDGGAVEVDVGACEGATLHTNQAGLGNPVITGGVMTAGAWHCLQWQFDASASAPANAVNIWLDGTLVVSLPVAKGWTFPSPWNSFDLGFSTLKLTNSVEVFLDDFALDGQRVPCPP